MILVDEWQDYQRWAPELLKIADERFYPRGWLDGEVWSGRARFWCNEKAAIVARFEVYPSGARAVHGLCAAGEACEVRKLIPAAEAWGRELGAVVAEIDSRIGWAKVLDEDGYSLHQSRLRKELA